MTNVTDRGPLHRASERRPEDSLDPDVLCVMRPGGGLDPAEDPHLSDAEVLALYRAMVRTRVVDERAVALQRQGRIGFHIGSLGEEATIIGSAFALRPQDWLFPCYREFGAALWRGLPLERYFDNLFGNAGDLVKGRQMPDHWCDREHKLGSVSSPIGTQITQAVGFAWAAQLRREDVVALVYFGDGATSSSDFHNGLNFAGVYRTPAVLLCRNNGWAISVPTGRQTASAGFASKGAAYGIRGVRCDGNDIFAVVRACRQAVARASRGEGPTLVEALTYRMSGHSTSDDPKAYRPEVELDPWHKLNPIRRLRAHLDARALWNDSAESALEADLHEEVRACLGAAEKKPPPALETMFDDVFAELPWHLREQRHALLTGTRAKGHGG